MLIAVVMKRHWEYYKIGIDMTSAFDTIKRSTILRLLDDAGCTSDDIRLVRLLLSNTKVRVRVNKSLSAEFVSSVGAFQGDSLSGGLFTLSLAGALNHLRAVSGRPNPPVADIGLPLEWEYADDTDFIDEDEITLTELLPVCTKVLNEWDLTVNESKTEYVHIFLSQKDEVDSDGNSLNDNEPWRSSKALGSQLCSSKDIAKRCILGNLAFNNFSKIWLQGSKIPLDKKIRIYDAQVVSIILYNSNSWGTSKAVLNKLDVVHRKHLRRILNIHWPHGVISNVELYRRCKCIPLSERVNKYRWTMLGHVLRSEENCPALLALRFAVEGSKKYKGRVGRHRCNLLDTLRDDLKTRHMMLRNVIDFENIKHIASDRVKWRKLFSNY